MNRIAALLTCMLALAAATSVHAQSTSCLVLGSKTARVSSSEGERSPVFVAKECQSLKLVSGSAQASWVGRDGKPRLVPVTAEGVTGAPAPGAEERSVNTVWAELTTRREKQQPAYMRSFGQERTPVVYVPESGLVVVDKADSSGVVRISAPDADLQARPWQRSFAAGEAIVLPRSELRPGALHTVQIQRGDLVEEWKWRVSSALQQAQLDEQMRDVERSIDAPEQRALVAAMIFEQLRLRINMDLVVQQLRGESSAVAR